jgi:putative ABC transport system permease protein
MSASQLKLAARNLTRHRTRTLISLSSIAFGVIAVLLAGGFIEWIFAAMREATIQGGLGHIQITRRGFRDSGFADPSKYLLPPDDAELTTVRGSPGVEIVGERLVLSGLASSGETTVAFTGEAGDPDVERRINTQFPVAGEKLSSGDPSGVLLGRGLAASLGVGQGNVVTLMVSLPGGGINAVEGHVRGIFTTQVKAYDDNAVRMPLPLARQLLRVRGSHLWVVGLSTTERTEQSATYLRSQLPPGRFEVASWFDLSDFYRKAVVLLSRQIDLMALLIGVVIVLGISNTLMMNVFERTGEIGTLLAMGTRRRDILRQFVLEGLLLGIIGGLIGLILGGGLAQAVSYVGIPMPPPPGRDTGYSAQITPTVSLALWAFAMAVVSALLASLYPAWRAARLPIVDALRHNR